MLKPRRRAKPLTQAGQEALDALLARLRALRPRIKADPAAAEEYQNLLTEATRHDDTNIWLSVMDALTDREAEQKKKH